MQPNASDIQVGSTAKTRLMTFDCLDGRTRSAREARRLIETFRREVGGKLTPTQRIAAERWATLAVLAADARMRCLAGDRGVSLADVVKLDGAASRARRALLAIQRRPRKPVGPFEHLDSLAIP
jgi:hypothetical protein